MKTILGKIIITDKVYFEPEGLEKPSKAIYHKAKLYHFENLIIQKYEASKQKVEVENAVPHLMPRLNEQKADVYYDVIFSKDNFEQIKNNQICKAEIKGEKVIIISLTKE